MKIDKSKFLAALEMPVRIARSRTGLGGFARLLLRSVDGIAKIDANDGDQACMEMVESEGGIETVCVSAGSLQTAVEFAGDDIELSIDGGTLLRFKSWVGGRNRSVGLRLFDPGEFLDIQPAGKLTVAPVELLADGLEMVSPFAAANDSRYILKSVNAAGSATSLKCQACTWQQFGGYRTPAICADFNFLAPSEFVPSIVNSLRRPGAEILLADNQIQVRHKDGHYLCKPMEGEYPDTRDFFRAGEEIGIIARNEWLEIFRYIKSLRGDDENKSVKVKLEFSAKSCAIVSTGSNPTNESVEGNFVPSGLRINAISFEHCLAAFPDESLIKLGCFGGNEAVTLEEGDLRVLTTQLRA